MTSIYGLANKLTVAVLAASPDILLFTVLVTATALGDLNEVQTPPDLESQFKLFKVGLWVGAIFAAVLYGCLIFTLVFEARLGIEAANFRFRLLWASILIAIVFFFLSAFAETAIDALEDNQKQQLLDSMASSSTQPQGI